MTQKGVSKMLANVRLSNKRDHDPISLVLFHNYFSDGRPLFQDDLFHEPNYRLRLAEPSIVLMHNFFGDGRPLFRDDLNCGHANEGPRDDDKGQALAHAA